MKATHIIYILIFFISISCKEKETKIADFTETVSGTTKQYRKISIPYGTEKEISEEYEVYVSKKNDSFWNQWKFY